ncbi:MAG: DEAD/DEAH box helicase, partial [Nitrospirae bacterium]
MIASLLASSFEDLLQVPSEPVTIGGLRSSSKALFVALMGRVFSDRVHLVVLSRPDLAKTFFQDLRFYLTLLGVSEDRAKFLPEGEDTEELGLRFQCLLSTGPGSIVVGTERAFMRPTWKVEELKRLSLKILEGTTIERPTLIETIQKLGYKRTPVVKSPGEFIDRQWVIDIWPLTEPSPIRIEFFGDEIDKLKRVDPETQRSVEAVSEVMVLPVFETQSQQAFLEYSDDALWYLDETAQLPSGVSTSSVIRLHEMRLKGTSSPSIETLSGLGLTYRERNSFEAIGQRTKALVEKGHRFLFVLTTENQARALKELLREHALLVPLVPLESLSHYPEHPVLVTYGRLSSGIRTKTLLIVSSNDLFGPVPVSRKARSMRKLLEHLEDIKVGDYVVHQDYGIGIFRGLTKLKTQVGITEALMIEYRDGAKLYVPTYNIGLVEKYRAEEGVIPQLDPLDARAFKRKKERFRKKIQALAYKLLNLYARRQVLKGHAFTKETTLHREFEDLFPYEPTEDQLKAWEEIKKDMESPAPMDRLLTGDVGFGKTELAMRAAFKAVFDKKQVAIVVPTTILCEQHYINFKERFKQFGITVDYLSRFKSKREINETLKALEEGRVDIVIGTHLLLSPKVRFK